MTDRTETRTASLQARCLVCGDGAMVLASPSEGQSQFIHVLVVATPSPQACLDAITAIVRWSRCEIRGFSLKPVGAKFEAVLRIANLDDETARRVADQIASWPDAGDVHLEHLLVRS